MLIGPIIASVKEIVTWKAKYPTNMICRVRRKLTNETALSKKKMVYEIIDDKSTPDSAPHALACGERNVIREFYRRVVNPMLVRIYFGYQEVCTRPIFFSRTIIY